MASPFASAPRLIEAPELTIDHPRLLRTVPAERISLRHEPHILVVCGLLFEAQIAAGDGIAVVCAGEQRRLIAGLREAVSPATLGILSFGLAGGLGAALRPGTCIIGKDVIATNDVFATHAAWSRSMLASLPHAIHADICAVDKAVLRPADKRLLNTNTGAVAVDVESHIAGRFARERGIPFAALRVVVDPCHRPVPHCAIACHRPDGTADVRIAVAGLLRRPHTLPGMIRLGFDAWAASRVLLRSRRQLGHGFAFVDFAKHVVDVA